MSTTEEASGPPDGSSGSGSGGGGGGGGGQHAYADRDGRVYQAGGAIHHIGDVHHTSRWYVVAPRWYITAAAAALTLGLVIAGVFVADRIRAGVGGAVPAVSSSASPAGQLSVDAAWTEDLDLRCNQGVAVAGLPGGVDITELQRLPPGELTSLEHDLRTHAVKRLGAITWNRGLLTVNLSAVDGRPVFVVDVRAVVFTRESIDAAWGLVHTPQCGSPSYYRLFEATLDTGLVRDAGIVGQPEALADPAAARRVPVRPLGETFTVSDSDTAQLEFDVYACQGYYEWGLRIDYMFAGKKHSAWVGSRERPLRMIGGVRGVRPYKGDYTASGSPILDASLDDVSGGDWGRLCR